MGYLSKTIGIMGGVAGMVNAGVSTGKEISTDIKAGKEVDKFVSGKPNVVDTLAKKDKLSSGTETVMDEFLSKDKVTDKDVNNLKTAFKQDVKRNMQTKPFDMEMFMMANAMAQEQKESKISQRKIYIGGKR